MSDTEVIIVRSLAESDMGLFAAHRRAATSKQRAIALTQRAAEQLLHGSVLAAKRGEFDCICLYGDVANRELRLVSKTGKNWRLGGRKLQGKAFANLEPKDFALLRSVRQNDGSSPVLLTFVGRSSEQLLQAGLVATLGKSLRESVTVVTEGAPQFVALAGLFPSIPATVAMRPAALHPTLL